MAEPDFEFTEPTQLRLLTLKALKALTAPDLVWRPLGDIESSEPGPFVYVLTDGRCAWYPGKTDAAAGHGAKRAAAYPRWVAEYAKSVADGGRPDPIHDPATGNLSLVGWSGIVRFAACYNLYPLIASVAHTGVSGAVYEARVKALNAIFTGFESVSGASVWERKEGTLRADAYEWAVQQVEQFRRKP